MIVCSIACTVFVGLFVAAELRIHWDRMPLWYGLIYFVSVGVVVTAGAFALVNLILSKSATNLEARGFFELFATLGMIVVIGSALHLALLTLAQRRRLAFRSLLAGAAALFIATWGLLAVCARCPAANWW